MGEMYGPLANSQSMFSQKVLATARILAPLFRIRHELTGTVALETNQQVNKMAVVVARRGGGYYSLSLSPPSILMLGVIQLASWGWMED